MGRLGQPVSFSFALKRIDYVCRLCFLSVDIRLSVFYLLNRRTSMNQPSPKPRERRTGEPSIWYQRFRYYLDLGPNRSLNRTYREISNAQRLIPNISIYTRSF